MMLWGNVEGRVIIPAKDGISGSLQQASSIQYHGLTISNYVFLENLT